MPAKSASEPAAPLIAPAQAPAATCAGIGAVACETAPVSDKPADLCEQVKKCLLNKGDPDDQFGVITAIEDCEPVAQASDAPADSGLLGLGFVTMTGELGETPAEGTFLFARTAQGLCLADRVLNMEWFHGGHFENEIATRWEGNKLHVEAQRLKRIPIDQGEPYQPGADVDWIACERLVYEAKGGTLERLTADSSDTACKKAKKTKK